MKTKTDLLRTFIGMHVGVEANHESGAYQIVTRRAKGHTAPTWTVVEVTDDMIRVKPDFELTGSYGPGEEWIDINWIARIYAERG